MGKPYERGPVRRQQIVEAALALLAEDGLHALTTRRLAARVGLSEAALFRHFPDKQAILDAGLDHLEAAMFEAAGPPPPAPHEGPPPDPVARLERFFRRRVELVAGPTALGHLVFSEQLVHATGEPGRQRVAAWRARSAAHVGALLTELAAAGRLRRGFTPELLVPVVQGQVLGFVADRVVAPLSPEPLSARVDRAWALLSALVLEPAPAPEAAPEAIAPTSPSATPPTKLERRRPRR